MPFARRSLPAVVSALARLLALPAAAEMKVAPVFGDHMVLQRDLETPVWGTTAPGGNVTVKFRDQEKETTADDAGKWLVKLGPLTAGGPDEFTAAGGNTVTFKDVLVGEVWVGSGQSNMAMPVASYKRNDEVLAKAQEAGPYPKLRLLKGSAAPKWQEATPESVQRFSALLFSFGFRLQQELDVPVGLMVGAVGGTPSGYWVTEAAIAADPACRAALKKYVETHPEEAMKKAYDERVAKWEKAAAAAKEAGKRVPRRPAPFQKPGDLEGRKVGNLYARFIHPLVGYGIRGVLWDQGESGTRVQELDQFTIMGALIRGWRQSWGQGDFPFLYIQKPSGGGCAWEASPVTRLASKFSAVPAKLPVDGGYRELHNRIMTYPNTMMVTSLDLGAGVHPANKSAYGARACRVALGMVYQREVEACGPVYATHKVEGARIRVTFKHVGKGLEARHGERLQGFAVAGEDQVFHWADAAIEGETVLVSSEKVEKPVAVRYGWSRRRPWANFFNKDGLPALTFRTDKW